MRKTDRDGNCNMTTKATTGKCEKKKSLYKSEGDASYYKDDKYI